MTRLLPLALLTWACTQPDPDPNETPEPPEPGELVAGVARARIPAPVGIGTAGFGPIGAPPSQSPYSDIYPGTKRILGHPNMKAIAVSRGPGFEAVFLKLDTVGVFAQLRAEIVDEVSERLGRDMDDAIIVGATHTHSGPGRVLNSGSDASSPFDLIVDTFYPAFYDRFVQTAADTVVAALEDARPARIGTAMGLCETGHSDRRCEDGSYSNGAMPTLLIERDGQVDGVLLAYAVHGTMLGVDELFLSGDVSGAIEQAVEDRFDHPVQAMFFNSWGADMSPGNPEVALREGDPRVGDLPRMFAVGTVVADAVADAVSDATWFDEPEIGLQVHRLGIDRQYIGYDGGTFPHDHGAVYCTGEQECPAEERLEGLDRTCLPFGEEFPAPNQVDVTVGQLANWSVVTFPGEPGTLLAESLMDGLRTRFADVEDVLFLGFTQDYLGYSVLEDDWWLGGYEASGALWGPRQGAYLVEAIEEAYATWRGEGTATSLPALEPFPYDASEVVQPFEAADPNTVMTQPATTVAAGAAVEVVISGQDPWLGAPLARLERTDGVVATRPGGWVLDSDSYEFDVELTVDPPWADADDDGEIDRVPRGFAWRFRASTRSLLPDGVDLTGGSWQFVVDVPQPDGTTVEVRSEAFEVTE
jgi:hypothetical protein